MNTSLISQKISNSKLFNDVERTIKIVGIMINSDLERIDLYYRLNYSKEDQNVTQMFSKESAEWHIDNTQQMMVRDENFDPILNPNFKEEKSTEGICVNEDDRFQKMPGFDYITMLMLDKNVPIKKIISAYINEEDIDGRFDK